MRRRQHAADEGLIDPPALVENPAKPDVEIIVSGH
jgi:hypothetical protein